MLTTSLEPTQHQVTHELAPLLGPVVLPIVVLVLIVFAVKHIGVIAHEAAHAITGRSVGRKVSYVKLNSDATGETLTQGPEKGLGLIITGFAGYLGPSLFGLAAASFVALGYPKAVLGLTLLFLFILLFRVRNFFGVISVLANGALIVLVVRYGSAKLQDGAPPMAASMVQQGVAVPAEAGGGKFRAVAPAVTAATRGQRIGKPRGRWGGVRFGRGDRPVEDGGRGAQVR